MIIIQTCKNKFSIVDRVVECDYKHYLDWSKDGGGGYGGFKAVLQLNLKASLQKAAWNSCSRTEVTCQYNGLLGAKGIAMTT